MHLSLGDMLLGSSHRKVGRLLDAGRPLMQKFPQPHSPLPFQLLNIDLIAIFPDDIHHVNSHDNGMPSSRICVLK